MPDQSHGGRNAAISAKVFMATSRSVSGSIWHWHLATLLSSAGVILINPTTAKNTLVPFASATGTSSVAGGHSIHLENALEPAVPGLTPCQMTMM
jgi:hypothetical protein